MMKPRNAFPTKTMTERLLARIAEIVFDEVAADRALDRERGPLLLELNARPGLQIQVANQKGLLKNLDLVDKAPPDIFTTSETRVAWALDTLANPKS